MIFNSDALKGSLPTPEYTPLNSPASSPIRSKFEIPLIIAITGSAGLVGTSLVELALKQGHSILAMDILLPSDPRTKLPKELEYAKNRYEYKQVSALDYDSYKQACKESNCNAIVHLAMIPNGPDADSRIPGEHQGKPQHEVHNSNVAMSCNTLAIAAELGITRVVLASSVNAVGMLFSKRPTFDYLPIDEIHPCKPEDAYSMSKYFCELQADSYVRRYPSLRVASLRFHGVQKPCGVNRESLNELGGSWKDLWGWVSSYSVSKACLLSLTCSTETFPEGTHEPFFIVAPTICQQARTTDLLKKSYPEIISPKEGKSRLRQEIRGNEGLFECGKAKRMLGWEEIGFYYDGGEREECQKEGGP